MDRTRWCSVTEGVGVGDTFSIVTVKVKSSHVKLVGATVGVGVRLDVGVGETGSDGALK